MLVAEDVKPAVNNNEIRVTGVLTAASFSRGKFSCLCLDQRWIYGIAS